MPHARLVEISTQHAAAMGDAFAHLHKARVSGAPAPVMAALGGLEGALARLSEFNVALGEVAHGLSNDAPEPARTAPALSDPVALADGASKVDVGAMKDSTKR